MSNEAVELLKKAIVEYDRESAEKHAKAIVEKDIDPLEALNELTAVIRKVGEKFSRGELWLPDLVGAATAMQAAMPVLEVKLKNTKAKQKVLGTIVIGTVFGDIHTIGKTMVSTLFTAGGFKVHDLGVNIRADEFIKAIKKYKPDILAMSALMTTTAPEQRKVIEALKMENIRDNVKVMVGGGAINEEFAEGIGADGYEPTAPGAVELARQLVSE